MPTSLHQLTDSHCSVQRQCPKSLTWNYFSLPFFWSLIPRCGQPCRYFLPSNVTWLATINQWWRSRNFTHKQGLQILFAPFRAFFITNININGLHAFYDVKDLLIPTSCNIFRSHIRKHSKTHKSNDLIVIFDKIMRDNLQNFTFTTRIFIFQINQVD